MKALYMRQFFTTLAFFLGTFSAIPAVAQTYPEYASTTVNDYAGLLDSAAKARVEQTLIALKKDTGVEMTVLTLSSQDAFAPDLTLEKFSTGLFDEWGIGKSTTNDGVLIMVLKTDRAMRIELGSAYGRDWDRASAVVINRSALPAFKEDRFQDGIEALVKDTIETVVLPFQSGEDAPTGEANNWVWLIVMGVFGSITAFIFKDKLVKLKKCPQCGQRHLTRHRDVRLSPSKTQQGHGDMITECRNCTYRDIAPYTISRIGSSSSSSFGGGSSGGGGASGRW